MLLVPFKMETTFTRYPVANAVIIAATSILLFLPFTGAPSSEDLLPFVLRDWDISQMVGSLFLHGDFFHLLGNMLFLWVFGNAVNAAVGNIAYPFLYLCLGVCASVVHLSADAHPAIGASGAINGIVGIVLVMFPYNRIHTFYWYALPMWLGIKSGKFQTKTIWMILYWNIFDFIAVMAGSQDGIGHWAHIGGLTFGIAFALLAVKLKLVDTYSPSLLDVFAGRATQTDSAGLTHIEESMETQMKMNAMASDLSAIPVAITPEKPSPPKQPGKLDPEIRLTQCVGNGSMITCYVENGGGPMKNLMLKVPPGVVAQTSTNALYTGQSGWIRFRTIDGITIDSIEFLIGFKDARGAERKIRLRCVPSKQTLAEVQTVSRTHPSPERPRKMRI